MTARAEPSAPFLAPPLTRGEPGESGFTLIELLAVVGFTAVLMLFAVNFYIEITRASDAATEQTRDSRRAIALLDRIARDLEAAVLVKKPAELDPLYHPWIFLAEDRGGDEGAERLKFTTRSRLLRSTAHHESDLAMVSYTLQEAEDGGYELFRWSSPSLPEELDRSFPASDAEGAVLFADGLASFGIRFLDEAGEWTSEWDSSLMIDSSELPLAAEVSLAILPASDSPEEGEAELYQRRVVLPVRPIDLQALLDSGETDEEADCETGKMTVGACLNLEENTGILEQLQTDDPDLADEIGEVSGECFEDYSHLFDGLGLKGCR